MNDDPATGGVRTFDPATGGKAHKIARADLAAGLVAQLDDSAHVHRTVTVANSRPPGRNGTGLTVYPIGVVLSIQHDIPVVLLDTPVVGITSVLLA